MAKRTILSQDEQNEILPYNEDSPNKAKVTHADDDEARTVLTDWLIDSGCSAPMTPHRENFDDHLMDFSCAVEVATGTLVPCYF